MTVVVVIATAVVVVAVIAAVVVALVVVVAVVGAVVVAVVGAVIQTVIKLQALSKSLVFAFNYYFTCIYIYIKVYKLFI